VDRRISDDPIRTTIQHLRFTNRTTNLLLSRHPKKKTTILNIKHMKYKLGLCFYSLDEYFCFVFWNQLLPSLASWYKVFNWQIVLGKLHITYTQIVFFSILRVWETVNVYKKIKSRSTISGLTNIQTRFSTLIRDYSSTRILAPAL
jgi:hypothetical protein